MEKIKKNGNRILVMAEVEEDHHLLQTSYSRFPSWILEASCKWILQAPRVRIFK